MISLTGVNRDQQKGNIWCFGKLHNKTTKCEYISSIIGRWVDNEEQKESWSQKDQSSIGFL